MLIINLFLDLVMILILIYQRITVNFLLICYYSFSDLFHKSSVQFHCLQACGLYISLFIKWAKYLLAIISKYRILNFNIIAQRQNYFQQVSKNECIFVIISFYTLHDSQNNAFFKCIILVTNLYLRGSIPTHLIKIIYKCSSFSNQIRWVVQKIVFAARE